MIIKAENGHRLTLTSTRLTEIDHNPSNVDDCEDDDTYDGSKYPYHTLKSDIREALKNPDVNGERNGVTLRGRYSSGEKSIMHNQPFSVEKRRIGCKTFTPRTFNLILSTMGLLPKKVKATK